MHGIPLRVAADCRGEEDGQPWGEGEEEQHGARGGSRVYAEDEAEEAPREGVAEGS